VSILRAMVGFSEARIGKCRREIFIRRDAAHISKPQRLSHLVRRIVMPAAVTAAIASAITSSSSFAFCGSHACLPRIGGLTTLRAKEEKASPLASLLGSSAGTTPPPAAKKKETIENVEDAVAEEKAEVEEEQDLSGIEMPKVLLPGPLRPPAAPATYQALTKSYLRRAPSRIADVMTGVAIEPGAEFDVLEAKEDEDGELLYLRVDSTYDNGWLLDRGAAGQWAGKRVVKRIPGSLRARAAIHTISEMTPAEVAEGEKTEASQSTPKGEGEFPPALLAVLDDPAVRKLCMQMGMGPDELKKKPDFLRAVARKLYGEEVVE